MLEIIVTNPTARAPALNPEQLFLFSLPTVAVLLTIFVSSPFVAAGPAQSASAFSTSGANKCGVISALRKLRD